MIFAGLTLLTVGAVDLVRQFLPRRWIGYLLVVFVVLSLGVVSAAVVPAVGAVAVAGLWWWTMPDAGKPRLLFWPAVLLALTCTIAVVTIGDRATPTLFGSAWQLETPIGPASVDLVMLVLGIFVFLLESSNRVVRAALRSEQTPADLDATPGSRGSFAGGRLIGPLERVSIFLLTLAGAYSLIAAMLAAKGIVRFPEISKDGETGARAEYFLVGSLVSWVTALAGAFLVWWASRV